MRKLGEQWIELIDEQEHMVKAVQSVDIGACTACDFEGQESKCAGFPNSVCGRNSNHFIIKDLGILNEDGCLPSPWGGYPKIVRVGREGFCTYKVRFYLKHGMVYGFTLIEVTGNTRQEAIDAWNRRV